MMRQKSSMQQGLLRDDAGTWITPYAEEQITPAWDNWAGFKAELQRQFGVIDAQG